MEMEIKDVTKRVGRRIDAAVSIYSAVYVDMRQGVEYYDNRYMVIRDTR